MPRRQLPGSNDNPFLAFLKKKVVRILLNAIFHCQLFRDFFGHTRMFAKICQARRVLATKLSTM